MEPSDANPTAPHAAAATPTAPPAAAADPTALPAAAASPPAAAAAAAATISAVLQYSDQNMVAMGLFASMPASMAATKEAFYRLLDDQPELIAQYIASAFSDPTQRPGAARVLCDLLLVPELGSDRAMFWSRLPDAVQKQAKHSIRVAFYSEPSITILKLATQPPVSSWAEAWPHFLPFLMRSTAASQRGDSDCFKHQEAAMFILSTVQPIEALSDALDALCEVLVHHLSHYASDLRIRAIGATANCIKCLPTKTQKKKLAVLLMPLIVTALYDCLDPDREESAQAALLLLVDLAVADPGFLRLHLEDMETPMLKIAMAKELTSGTRCPAVLFCHNIVEGATTAIRAETAMRKVSALLAFAYRLAEFLMDLILEVDDDSIWPLPQAAHGEQNIHEVAQRCLHQLSIAVGGNALVPVALPWITKHLAAEESEWKSHYAALVSVAQIADGCDYWMLHNLDKVVPMILKGLEHPHSGVQCAAIDGIYMLCEELGLDKYAPQNSDSLLSLARAMFRFVRPVQEHAANTLSKILKNTSVKMHAVDVQEIVSLLQDCQIGDDVMTVSNVDSLSLHGSTSQQVPRIPQDTVNIQAHRIHQSSQAAVQQPEEPVNKKTLIEYMKALSNGAVTTTASLNVYLATTEESWPKELKFLLHICLYTSLPFCLVTTGFANSVEHHPEWLNRTQILILSVVSYTLAVGGLVGLAKESIWTAGCVSTLAVVVFLAFWSIQFNYPKWLKKGLAGIWQPCASQLRSIRERLVRMITQVDGAPERRGGWFSWRRRVREDGGQTAV